MKKIPSILTALILGMACIMAGRPGFITVEDGRFMKDGRPYKYVGTNFWYGAILGSQGRGGDRGRLTRELDFLQHIGIDNIRVLVGGEGDETVASHIQPVLQTAPGVYNDTILDGLDYLMAELERRDMKAVLYLTNAWEWSGGYGTYLEWAGEGKAPDPKDGYKEYTDHVSKFVTNEKAKKMYADHVNHIVSRTNRYTGKPYSESPAIMSWQVANEPRCFSREPASLQAFKKWILDTARQIKRIDPNHMVSTGSEGKYGCEVDIDLWNSIHSSPEIDYGIIHLWPSNWNWVEKETLIEDLPKAFACSDEYILPHAEMMKKAGKPLVLEEFGYPRDNYSFAPGSPTTGRDAFYEHVFKFIRDSDLISGCNFWAWGGFGQPKHERWQPGDDYTGDPAQEEQGLYSVFVADKSTIDLIRRMAKEISRK